MTHNNYHQLQQMFVNYVKNLRNINIFKLKERFQFVTVDERYRLICNLKKGDGYTLLTVAIINNQLSIIECLLSFLSREQRYKQESQWSESESHIYITVWFSSKEMVKCVLNSVKANKRFKLLMLNDDCGYTLLHQAVFNGNSEMVRCILELVTVEQQSTLLRVQNDCGHTAIHHVVKKGEVEMLKCMLDFVPVEESCHLFKIQSEHEWTAVHDAVLNGCEKVIGAILEGVPSTDRYKLLAVQNRGGYNTALELALNENKRETVELIIQWRSSAENRRTKGMSRTGCCEECLINNLKKYYYNLFI